MLNHSHAKTCALYHPGAVMPKQQSIRAYQASSAFSGTAVRQHAASTTFHETRHQLWVQHHTDDRLTLTFNAVCRQTCLVLTGCRPVVRVSVLFWAFLFCTRGCLDCPQKCPRCTQDADAVLIMCLLHSRWRSCNQHVCLCCLVPPVLDLSVLLHSGHVYCAQDVSAVPRMSVCGV